MASSSSATPFGMIEALVSHLSNSGMMSDALMSSISAFAAGYTAATPSFSTPVTAVAVGKKRPLSPTLTTTTTPAGAVLSFGAAAAAKDKAVVVKAKRRRTSGSAAAVDENGQPLPKPPMNAYQRFISETMADLKATRPDLAGSSSGRMKEAMRLWAARNAAVAAAAAAAAAPAPAAVAEATPNNNKTKEKAKNTHAPVPAAPLKAKKKEDDVLARFLSYLRDNAVDVPEEICDVAYAFRADNGPMFVSAEPLVAVEEYVRDFAKYLRDNDIALDMSVVEVLMSVDDFLETLGVVVSVAQLNALQLHGGGVAPPPSSAADDDTSADMDVEEF